MIYPKAVDNYYLYKQNQLIEAFEVVQTTSQNDTLDTTTPNNNEFDTTVGEVIEFVDESSSLDQEDSVTSKQAIQAKDEAKQALIKSHTEAILKIDAINLKIPILDGASDANLRLSVASLKESGKPWTSGNYAIAGHRSRTYGKQFNRLNDLTTGHLITIIGLDSNTYVYEIVEKTIVHETDSTVLEPDLNQKTVTLITCHPLNEKNPPNRLIIKGNLISE